MRADTAPPKTADKGMANSGRGIVTPPAAAAGSRPCLHKDQAPATANKGLVNIGGNVFRPPAAAPGKAERQLAHRTRPTPQLGFAQTCKQQNRLGKSTGARKPTTKSCAATSTRVIAFSQDAPRGHRVLRRDHRLSRKSRLISGRGAHAGAKRLARRINVGVACSRLAKIQICGRDNGHAQAASGNLPFGALCGGGASAQKNPAGFGGDAWLALPPSRWHPMGDVTPGAEGGEARALRPQVPRGGMERTAVWAARKSSLITLGPHEGLAPIQTYRLRWLPAAAASAPRLPSALPPPARSATAHFATAASSTTRRQ